MKALKFSGKIWRFTFRRKSRNGLWFQFGGLFGKYALDHQNFLNWRNDLSFFRKWLKGASNYLLIPMSMILQEPWKLD